MQKAKSGPMACGRRMRKIDPTNNSLASVYDWTHSGRLMIGYYGEGESFSRRRRIVDDYVVAAAVVLQGTVVGYLREHPRSKLVQGRCLRTSFERNPRAAQRFSVLETSVPTRAFERSRPPWHIRA
jgi:hypothetical protein